MDTMSSLHSCRLDKEQNIVQTSPDGTVHVQNEWETSCNAFESCWYAVASAELRGKVVGLGHRDHWQVQSGLGQLVGHGDTDGGTAVGHRTGVQHAMISRWHGGAGGGHEARHTTLCVTSGAAAHSHAVGVGWLASSRDVTRHRRRVHCECGTVGGGMLMQAGAYTGCTGCQRGAEGSGQWLHTTGQRHAHTGVPVGSRHKEQSSKEASLGTVGR